MRILRPSESTALYSVVQHNRAHLRQWLPWVDATRHPADTRLFIETSHAAFQRGTAATYGVRLRGSLAGVVGFHGFDRINRITSVGYWLARDACGNGIMRSCVAACVDYAFEREQMNRFYIRCAVGNQRSKRIPLSLGFRLEGVQREAEWLYDHFVDLEVYSLLAGEWDGLRTVGA